MYPVAVLAGGLGTRMAGRTGPGRPKALLEVAGRPFIDLKLAQLAAQGAERVVLLTGHGSAALAGHVGDGSRHGVSVQVVADGPVLLGTGGALRRAAPVLGSPFWVTYGDTLLTVAVGDAERAFGASGRQGLMTVLRNRDAWDPSNLAVRDGLVTEYRKGAPPGTYEYIDYGMSILTGPALQDFPDGRPFDLAAVFQAMIAARELLAFEVSDRFYEVGSEAGYQATEAHLRSSGLPRG